VDTALVELEGLSMKYRVEFLLLRIKILLRHWYDRAASVLGPALLLSALRFALAHHAFPLHLQDLPTC
jgi:hypothetical protein